MVMKPNIVIIVQDSVRAQNLPLYGYEKNTTPYLQRIAENSVVYQNTISAATSTVPSHASIFTGTHVSSHKLFLNKKRLRKDYITLAEVLKGLGYNTYGICYQDDVSPTTGLHRGFDKFDMMDEPGFLRMKLRNIFDTKTKRKINSEKIDMPREMEKGKIRKLLIQRIKTSKIYKFLYWTGTNFVDQGADSSAKKIARFFSTINKKDPFFIYLHYDEAHLPYRPCMPYRKKFMEGIIHKKPSYLINQDRNSYFIGEETMNKIDFETLEALYNGAIGYLDLKTWEIYNYIEKMGVLNNTMFVVMSDHGDNIGEHGLMSHKFCVYDSLIKVPMVIHYPKGVHSSGSKGELCQTTDLFPTVLELLNVKDQRIDDQIEGNSLLSSDRGKRPNDLAISELLNPFGVDLKHKVNQLRKYNRNLLSIRTSKYKYIYASDHQHEFYDLLQDPDETKNLISTNQPQVGRIQHAVGNYIKRFELCCKKFEI